MRYIVTIGGREIEVDVDGEQVSVAGRPQVATLSRVPGTPVCQLMVDGRPEAMAVEGAGEGRWTITRRGERCEIEVLDERTRHIRSLTGGAGRARGPATLKAPMPGLVVTVQVEPGQAVAPGTGVVVLEAMKMENELRATAPGVVRTVRVRPGEAVEKGQVLVEFDAGT